MTANQGNVDKDLATAFATHKLDSPATTSGNNHSNNPGIKALLDACVRAVYPLRFVECSYGVFVSPFNAQSRKTNRTLNARTKRPRQEERLLFVIGTTLYNRITIAFAQLVKNVSRMLN
jgi:hypothetical protein